VSFIHVAYGRIYAHRTQRSDPTDPENHLLLDPKLRIAAVKAPCKVSIRRQIAFEVGVQQE
jgi:hypothetical protein